MLQCCSCRLNFQCSGNTPSHSQFQSLSVSYCFSSSLKPLQCRQESGWLSGVPQTWLQTTSVICSLVFMTRLCLWRSIAMAAGSRVASRYLHQKMLVNIMHSPMSFFETTPQGRIMNRFSKDMSGIDDMVLRSLTSFLRTFLSVIGTMFAITFATPIFLAVIIPLGALYFFIQVRPLFAWNPVNRFSVYDNMIENFTCHFKINLVVFVFHYCFEIEMLFDPSSIFRRWRLFIIWNLPAKHTDYKALWRMFSLAKQFSPKFHCSFLYRSGCSLFYYATPIE